MARMAGGWATLERDVATVMPDAVAGDLAGAVAAFAAPLLQKGRAAAGLVKLKTTVAWLNRHGHEGAGHFVSQILEGCERKWPCLDLYKMVEFLGGGILLRADGTTR